MEKLVYLVKDLSTGKYFKHYWEWVDFNENPVIYNSISAARRILTYNSHGNKKLKIITFELSELINIDNKRIK